MQLQLEGSATGLEVPIAELIDSFVKFRADVRKIASETDSKTTKQQLFQRTDVLRNVELENMGIRVSVCHHMICSGLSFLHTM
jgi:hypothetical protein